MPHQIIDWPAQCCVIPLDQAWFCESCRAITNVATCCTCASAEHAQRLAPWLDREPEPISIPRTGVFLTVIPTSKKLPVKATGTPLLHTSASRLRKRGNRQPAHFARPRPRSPRPVARTGRQFRISGGCASS
jgi:hypothetical protein